MIADDPILGAISPDWIGAMLGTGYVRFEGRHFAGLYRVLGGDCLDLLAIVAVEEPGSGKFAAFLNELKSRYRMIRFYEISNPRLLKTLIDKHGFKFFDEFAVTGPNVQWEKKP